MEATGMCWIPIYELLEARGLEVLLVHARHPKHEAAAENRRLDVSGCATSTSSGCSAAVFDPRTRTSRSADISGIGRR